MKELGMKKKDKKGTLKNQKRREKKITLVLTQLFLQQTNLYCQFKTKYGRRGKARKPESNISKPFEVDMESTGPDQ